MIDGVEELGQIDIHGDAPATPDLGLYLVNRLVCVAATRLGYFYPTHWLRLISPVHELFFDGWPVRPSIGGELRNGHTVNTRRTLIGLHPLPCPAQVVARQHPSNNSDVIKVTSSLLSSLGQCWSPVASHPVGLIDVTETHTPAPQVSWFGP